MRSHTQSVVIELNRRRITGCISYKPLISDISVLIVCNKTGGTIKGDIKKNLNAWTSQYKRNMALWTTEMANARHLQSQVSTNCPEICRHPATLRAVFEHMIPVPWVPYTTRPSDQALILQKVIASTLVPVCRIYIHKCPFFNESL